MFAKFMRYLNLIDTCQPVFKTGNRYLTHCISSKNSSGYYLRAITISLSARAGAATIIVYHESMAAIVYTITSYNI